MKFSSLSTLLSSFLIFLTTLSSTNANYFRCIDNIDYDTDYFPNKIELKHATQWSITYHNTYKVIHNHAAGTSYLLYQCGSEVPEAEVGKHNMTVSVPLEDGVVIGSTTMIPHLEQLGLRRQIKGILGDPQYVSSPCINTLLSEGSITGINGGWYSGGVNLDDLLLDAPTAVVLRSSATDQDVNAMVISGYAEEESLDIYEWHKLYGALFNLEATATKQFDEAEERYECVSDKAASIAATETATSKPKVVWASHSTWSTPNYWDVARCDDTNNYYCEFADRCKAELLHSNDGSIENDYADGDYHMTDEEFFEFAKDADYWIYTSNNWDATFNKFGSNFTEFKSVKNEEVYDTEGGAWFEQRIAEFDIVLQDFCEVVGHYDNTPTAPAHTRQYFRKILPAGEEPIPPMGVCKPGFVDTPWESRVTECTHEEEIPESMTILPTLKFAFFAPFIVGSLFLI